MYCPYCGNKLVLIEQSPPPEVDWYLMDEALAKSIAANAVKPLLREEYACSKGCFTADCPLYFHHPFRGIDSAPGDSWSLSWVE